VSTAEFYLPQANVAANDGWRRRSALVVGAWTLAAALPLVGLVSLLLREQLDAGWSNPRVHFTVFLSVGVGVFVLAYAAGGAANRRGDARVRVRRCAPFVRAARGATPRGAAPGGPRPDMKLVGIVEDKLTDSTRGTGGERVRRYKMVSLGLDRAAEAARRAGVLATTTVRGGNAIDELVREADAAGSGELFFIRARGRIGAALARKPRRELARVSLGVATVAELAKAA
jgi:hypothetical protein